MFSNSLIDRALNTASTTIASPHSAAKKINSFDLVVNEIGVLSGPSRTRHAVAAATPIHTFVADVASPNAT